MKILCLIPVKPNLHPVLKHRLVDNVQAMQTQLGSDVIVVMDDMSTGDAHIHTFEERARHITDIRNGMIDKYINLWSQPQFSHILWIDADVDFRPEVILALQSRTPPTGVSAPMVYFERSFRDGRRRFYDTYGFVDMQERMATPEPPHIQGREWAVPMKSVGTFYMVPCLPFRLGYRYQHIPGRTEHYSICQIVAKEPHGKITVYRDLEVVHADLKKYEGKDH